MIFPNLTKKLLTPFGPSLLLGRCLMSTSADYDIIVAGGGLVGAAMARSMAQNKALKEKKILILEGGKEPAQREKTWSPEQEYSNRVIALNNSSKDLFSCIGVWDPILSARVKTVLGMHVWDSKNDRKNSTLVSFEAEQNDDLKNNLNGHFYIAENDLIVHELMRSAAKCPNVDIRYSSSAVQCHWESGTSHVKLKDGNELRTSLLIGADGANSIVRKAMRNSRLMSKNYDQMGVVATLHLAEEIPNTHAWQKFLPTGPIALLPLSGNRSSLVWTLPTSKARAVLGATEDEALSELLLHLGAPPKVREPFPSIAKISNVAGFPLGLGHSTRYCQPGMVLVGDAAHRVHPLAGQGVNLGFGDVECLTRVLEQNILDGAKLGSMDYLLDYESERQRQNVPMMLGIDFFQQVYGSDNEIVATARRAGISVVNSSPILKKLISGFAA